jgi:hypothetical protein
MLATIGVWEGVREPWLDACVDAGGPDERWSSPEWTYSGTLAGEAGERGDAG